MAQIPSSRNTTCTAVDNSFGPYASECRGGFDFTLFFEETVLTILPLAVFSLMVPVRVWYLLRRERKVVYGNLGIIKLVSYP